MYGSANLSAESILGEAFARVDDFLAPLFLISCDIIRAFGFWSTKKHWPVKDLDREIRKRERV